jgi:hypothetical protein
MTFKEDFKPSRVYNKLVIDAINKDIALVRIYLMLFVEMELEVDVINEILLMLLLH